MKKNILFFLTLLLSNLFTLSAQEYFNSEAEKYIKGTQHIRYTEFSDLPDYVKMKPGNEIPSSGFVLWARKVLFENDNSIELLPYQTNKDELGYTHTRYQQHYKGIPVEGAVLNTHSINGRVISFNGRLAGFSTADYQHSLNESTALNFALAHVNAESYKWEIEAEEKHVHEHSDMESYFPKGNLVWISDNGNFKSLRKAWKFNIYAHQPLYRAEVYVDAVTGDILFENNLIHHADANGTAVTGYSGTKPIVADSFGGSYRLREAGRSGVQTYNMQRGTNYGNAVDFTDGDNYWNNVNANLDQYATDAHWGAEMTYDYYLNVHNRNSINGNGMIMRSYVHYDANYFNAFWDGQRVTYGDGDSNNPLVSLDICGHEFTHGVTGFTAGLVYQNQSGALNESFSDIFGAAIEFYTTPGSADWLMGEDIGATLRSMSNPNAYGDPDTYNGTNWYTGTGDNGGVHTNSGVQNHWFYRLTVGGTGTNDIGNAFNVTAIGITDAARIAYRNLTVYLGSNSNYADARFYAIQAAIDLFGPCTQQVISTTNAWYAVGVGAAFNGVVTADFTANLTAACTAPFTVTFTNQSTNGGSFSWNFGDGNTSTATSPTHTYTNFGTYTVTLTAAGGSCGSDTEVKTNFISIDANNPCIAILPASGTGQTQTSCQGTMYDNGGPNANYVDQADVVMTIAPPGASSVSINFTSFSFESGYDYVYVYNGPTTASPLLGQYSGSTLPNGGNVISSTTGSITIRQTSDQNLNYPGFSLNWACVIPNSPPLVNFAATPVTSCSGTIAFTDNSIPTPTSWLWDFGDGSTSTQQNPTHTYTADGTYTITLTSTNNFGSNTLVRTALVTVDKPSAPNVTPGFRCNPGTITLAASALSGGTLSWYAAPTGGSAIATGTTYTTPVLINTTNYYVEEFIPQPSQNVGPANNSIGAGGNFNGTQSLLFDAYTPFTLVSVLVYANGAGNRTIELRNSGGTVLQSITVNIPNGTSRVTLNLNVPAGNSLQLGVTANANLYRNSAGAVFPYTIPGTVSITGSTAGGAFYYSFYDWEIVKPNCISERAQITATINAEPTVTDASRCGSGSVALTAAGAADLNWYDAASGGNLVNTGTTFNTPTLNSTTTYYVGSDVVTPSLYVGPADNNFGDGGNFTGNQHLKFNCTSNFTLVSVKVYAQGAGNRTIELRNSGGAVLQTLTANIPTGESRVTLNFNITPGTQYQLAINGTPNLYRNSNNAVYPYTLPGVVSITGSSAGVAGYYYFFYDWEIRQPGCSTARVPVTATINPLPEVSVSNDQNSCAGDEVILNASGIVGDLVWLPGGETTTSISINPTSTSTYTASATNSCGTATDDVTVTIIPEPAVTVSNDQSLCAGNSVTLDASGIEGSIVWSPGGETSTSITVNPTSQTTYTATATNTCGSASDAVTVTVNPLPAVTASADENSCAGDAVTLSASGVTGNLLWSPGGATTASITVSPSSSQTYTVMASNSCGTVSDAVDVNVTPLPTVTASSDQSVCAGAMVTLGTSGAVGNLVWMPGGETTSSITVSPTENTTYTVTASNSCGSVSETIEVTIGTTPSVDAGADAAICQGESITLSASGSGTFLWLPGGETTSSITVNPLTMQTYTVSAVSSCGTATDNVTVNVNSAEIPVITDNGGILVSSPASSYQWYFNFTAITGANNQEYTPSEEGIYSVEITDANGCSAYSEDYVFTTTGILAASDLTFKVYPNPNYGVFTIACTSIVSDIMIYNALGELVKTSASNSASGNITIDISNVEAGVYFVEARTVERNFVERVVVGN